MGSVVAQVVLTRGKKTIQHIQNGRRYQEDLRHLRLGRQRPVRHVLPDGRGVRRRVQRDQEDLHGPGPAGGGEEEVLLLRRGRHPGQPGHQDPRVLGHLPRLRRAMQALRQERERNHDLAELENILSNLLTRSPRRTPWPSWPSWLTPRTRTACSPTSHSWTGSPARHKRLDINLENKQTNYDIK